jgi:4-diphosphocytidyl-2-C-methyl-D-erythritol kinase
VVPKLRAQSRLPLAALASAKVNLTLEIKGRRPDGYHELRSLVLFADYGDRLSIEAADEWSFAVEGPFASAIEGGNLVERAAQDFAESFGIGLRFACRLAKNLPVAAGLGGGSSDAAAMLRLLREHFGRPADTDALIPLAARLGADVPCCLLGRAALMTGIGERLAPLPPVPAIPAILANPMRPLATRDVFRALAARPLATGLAADASPDLPSPDALLAFAGASRNDLQPPAVALMPVIGEVLATLQALPGARLARLSGSGPTCFALFGTPAEASAAAETLAVRHPAWWVRAVSLN